MMPILETQRLKLREFSQDDLDDLAAMVADEDQMRFYPRPKTRDEASAWISRNLALSKKYGFGFWFIESLPSSDFLGYCGIRPLALDGASELEIGWHTMKTTWNQGIATEAAMETSAPSPERKATLPLTTYPMCSHWHSSLGSPLKSGARSASWV
jgi:RimJ/RimL family protein N-acetyltransferase